MGQTLTHGIYLPDEGERNCYAGLASNWSILDGAVGTVAEHTSQIAGKAPAVHTHTKADITDFPAYGNAAGTICEGNDSRLSDARTPVAHTHGKADITDLFNSANTWSGEQTFSQTIQGNAATASAFDTAKPITLTGSVTGTVSGTNSWEIATALKTGSANTGSTVSNPYFKIASWEVAPNKYFGAILQIQNKCYPHSIATLTLSVRTNTNATFQRGYSIFSNVRGFSPNNFILCYKEVTGKVLCELYYYTTISFNGIRFSVISEGINNDDSLFNTMEVYQSPAGIASLPSDYTVIETTIGTYTQDFIPDTNNTYDLGSSSYQWNNLYAKNYYYNGTAWGLDKANVWSQSQTISASTNKAYIINNTSYTLGEETPSSTKELGGVFFKDSNSNNAAYLNVGHEKTTGDVYTRILTRFKFDNGVKSITGSSVNTALDIGLTNSAEKFVRPSADGEVNLGNSTYRWKTLNGVNPGALSFPNYDDTTYIDISGSIVPPSGQTTINYSGGENQYVPPVDGWLSIRCDGATFLQIYRNAYNCPGTTASRQDASGKLVVTLPVLKNKTYTIKINTSGTTNIFQLYPCLGNV